MWFNKSIGGIAFVNIYSVMNFQKCHLVKLFIYQYYYCMPNIIGTWFPPQWLVSRPYIGPTRIPLTHTIHIYALKGRKNQWVRLGTLSYLFAFVARVHLRLRNHLQLMYVCVCEYVQMYKCAPHIFTFEPVLACTCPEYTRRPIYPRVGIWIPADSRPFACLETKFTNPKLKSMYLLISHSFIHSFTDLSLLPTYALELESQVGRHSCR